jgi:hypothetical protein
MNPKYWRTCPFPPHSNLFNLASLKHGCKASLFLFSKMGIKETPQILGLFLIQVDIGGHPPFPTGSKQFSGNFGNLLFLAGLTSRAILRA